MLTTPLDNLNLYTSYFHNPIENESFIKALSPKEKQIYALGYIQAAHQIQENVSDTKRIILGQLMDEKLSNTSQVKNEACLRLLDSLDNSLAARIERLQDNFGL